MTLWYPTPHRLKKNSNATVAEYLEWRRKKKENWERMNSVLKEQAERERVDLLLRAYAIRKKLI